MLRYEKITTLDGRPVHGLWNRSLTNPVLFLHGFGATGMSWLNVVSGLDDGGGLIAIDLPGHGGSRSLFAEASLEVFAETVEAIVQAMALDAVHLVGHSMGAAVSVALASRLKLSISSLTLVSCAGVTARAGSTFFRDYVEAAGVEEMRCVLGGAVSTAYDVPLVMARTAYGEVSASGARQTLGKIAEIAERGVCAPVSSLQNFNRPVNVIWGRDDAITPVEDADAFRGFGRVDILDGVGHLPHIEAPGAVRRVIQTNRDFAS